MELARIRGTDLDLDTNVHTLVCTQLANLREALALQILEQGELGFVLLGLGVGLIGSVQL